MSGYGDFSQFYDRLMTDVDYDGYADYLLSLFEKFGGKRPRTVLDVACGSGSLCEAFVKRGVDPIGIDASEEMLFAAHEKPLLQQHDVMLLQQDMRELDLYGTSDGAVCVLDSLNHLRDTADVACVLRRLRLFVEPGGLFIFDVNTPYKHREVLGNNAFVFEEEDFVCVWRNRYVSKTCTVDMLLDFFVETETGEYERLTDTVRERAYTRATWEKLLADTGWDPLTVFAHKTTEEPTDTCERWVFVARNNRTVEEATFKGDNIYYG
ncbi:MAG: class I SAM-dependent methyltransferase [Clostridia bacterium]|nr:class I SAM-dependent methyltransferase [Clostridia bacterium]